MEIVQAGEVLLRNSGMCLACDSDGSCRVHYLFTVAQVAITLLLSFLFLIVSESLDPYTSYWDTLMSRVGHMVFSFSMFQALFIKVDVTEEQSMSQQTFGEVLLAVHVGMVAAVIAKAVMSLHSFWGRASPQDTAEPRSRSNGNLTRVMEIASI